MRRMRIIPFKIFTFISDDNNQHIRYKGQKTRKPKECAHLEFNVLTVIVANEVKYFKWNDSHSFHLSYSFVLGDKVLARAILVVSFLAMAIRSPGLVGLFLGSVVYSAD